MFVHKRNLFDPVGGAETPERVATSRRKFLKRWVGISLGAAALGLAAYAGWKYYEGADEEVFAAGKPEMSPGFQKSRLFPARRDDRFEYHRPETVEVAAARYTNFYEFSRLKSSWRYVQSFRTHPWSLAVTGLCRNPMTLDMDSLFSQFATALCERQYRHRCVERWAMAIPWTGIPLHALIQAADPLAQATHVRFVSFHRPDQAPATSSGGFPWPYTEGLTLAEAANELTFLANGMYGHPLLKQHGAPIRLVVPWKYGYKSIKSIERIEFVDKQPTPFWTELRPEAYPFQSNVNPADKVPWSQASEQMLGTGEEYITEKFNGYGRFVAGLYSA